MRPYTGLGYRGRPAGLCTNENACRLGCSLPCCRPPPRRCSTSPRRPQCRFIPPPGLSTKRYCGDPCSPPPPRCTPRPERGRYSNKGRPSPRSYGQPVRPSSKSYSSCGNRSTCNRPHDSSRIEKCSTPCRPRTTTISSYTPKRDSCRAGPTFGSCGPKRPTCPPRRRGGCGSSMKCPPRLPSPRYSSSCGSSFCGSPPTMPASCKRGRSGPARCNSCERDLCACPDKCSSDGTGTCSGNEEASNGPTSWFLKKTGLLGTDNAPMKPHMCPWEADVTVTGTVRGHCTSTAVKCDKPSHLSGPEHKLFQELFTRYNHESRPVKNASHTVTVTFALALNQLLDLDEKNQVLTTSVWIYEEWIDESLKWSPEDYDGQSALMIPASNIWLPDIFIFNTAGPNMNGFVNVNGSKVAIQHDGNVKWMVPLMVASACAVDVTYFPYDRQSCEIKFGSWIYDMAQLNILIDADTPDLEHYVMNSEYDLEKVSLERGILDSSCCPGDGRHPMVKLTVKLRRKSLYYDYIVIAPTIMLCVMTLASFLLPCDRGEKMNIGLTVFLTLYVLQLRIADNVPDTNSTPILGVFMLVVMTFNCVSLIMATIVMNIKKLGDRSPCPDVPRWLFALCQHVIGRAVCTPYPWISDSKTDKAKVLKHSNMSSKTHDIQDDAAQPMIDSRLVGTAIITGLDTKFSLNASASAHHETKEPEPDENFSIPMNIIAGDTRCKVERCQKITKASQSDESKEFSRRSGFKEDPVVRQRRKRQGGKQSATEDPTSFWPLYEQNNSAPEQSHLVSDIRTHGFLMKKRWFYVAEVVDKFLFVVYLVLLTTSIFTVLFLIPVYFRDEST